MTEIGGYCPNCGAARQAGQNYCVRCGAALGTSSAQSAAASFGTQVTGAYIGAEPGTGNDAPYPGEAVLGAVLRTIFMPFICQSCARRRCAPTSPRRSHH